MFFTIQARSPDTLQDLIDRRIDLNQHLSTKSGLDFVLGLGDAELIGLLLRNGAPPWLPLNASHKRCHIKVANLFSRSWKMFIAREVGAASPDHGGHVTEVREETSSCDQQVSS
jgi:hypothetical protein